MNERKIVMSSEVVIFILLLVIVALILNIIPAIYRIKFLESALERAYQDFADYVILSEPPKEIGDPEKFKNDFNEKWNKVCESMKGLGNRV